MIFSIYNSLVTLKKNPNFCRNDGDQIEQNEEEEYDPHLYRQVAKPTT